MNTITLDKPLNLACSLESGQFFQWQRYEAGYVLQSGLRIFYLEHQENTLRYESISGAIDEAFLRSFFRMEDDISVIFHPWRHDSLLMKAYSQFEGLRLLRQEPWDCLVSFLCSAASNIPRITSNIRTLSDRFGVRYVQDGRRWSTLPTPEQLADVHLQALYDAGLGFRAKYLWGIVDQVRNGFHLESLSALSYPEAKTELMTLPGVGDKIADCVL
ncbi:MAG TPA: DNA glycosylase, partial [bacterium]|nr:DNA glycosylase [bacterium]